VSCAYYNGMWSADHLAKEARRLEASGRNVDARSYWSRAAVKAESMVVGHPNSRWAEDALVLQGEALARSGACARAQGTLALALRSVRDGALRERAALAAGECALEQNDPVGADGALGDVVVASPQTGAALIEAVGDLEPATWDAETVNATVIGPEHRRKMAGRR